MAESPSPALEAAAEIAVQQLEGEHAEDRAEAQAWLLAHPEPAVRALTARLSAASSGNDAALVRVLAEIDQPGRTEALVEVLERGRDNGAEDAAIALVAADPEAREVLRRVAAAGRPVSRRAVAVALAGAAVPWACEVLRIGLADPVIELRLVWFRAAVAAGCVDEGEVRTLAARPENAEIRAALLSLASPR